MFIAEREALKAIFSIVTKQHQLDPQVADTVGKLVVFGNDCFILDNLKPGTLFGYLFRVLIFRLPARLREPSRIG